MLETLDTVNWCQLYHAYGPATDVPDQLRLLAAPEEVIWSRAVSHLGNIICHQGTHWEASSYTIPFLCELVDTSSVQCRDVILRLLLYVALGDAWPDDATLPYDAPQRFHTAEGAIAADWHDVAQRLYEEKDDLDEHIQAKLDILVVAWERDAFMAMHERAEKLLTCAGDHDEQVAINAVAGIPWFTNIHKAGTTRLLEQLLGHRSHTYIATVLLTLGLMPSAAHPDVKRVLEHQVETGASFLIQLTGAIALAFLFENTITNASLQPLIGAEDHRRELDTMSADIPYQRPLIDFRHERSIAWDFDNRRYRSTYRYLLTRRKEVLLRSRQLRKRRLIAKMRRMRV